MKDIKETKAINPVIILGVIILLAAIATYIVPAGSFDRVADKITGYDRIDINSFPVISRIRKATARILKTIEKKRRKRSRRRFARRSARRFNKSGSNLGPAIAAPNL